MPRPAPRRLPLWPWLTQRLAGFAKDERGSMTVEFVIWVPVLTYIGIGMFVLNFYLATVSEVQQVANELVRSTISQLRTDKTDAALCSDLQSFILPRVVQTMTLLTEARFRPLTSGGCLRDGSNFLVVTVSYDLSGTPLSQLARVIGFSIDTVERKSVVQL